MKLYRTGFRRCEYTCLIYHAKLGYLLKHGIDKEQTGSLPHQCISITNYQCASYRANGAHILQRQFSPINSASFYGHCTATHACFIAHKRAPRILPPGAFAHIYVVFIHRQNSLTTLRGIFVQISVAPTADDTSNSLDTRHD